MNFYRNIRWSAVAMLVAAGSLAMIGVADAVPPPGLRFNSPEVLDLSERLVPSDQGLVVPVIPLASEEGERILAAPALDEEQGSLAFSNDLLGCKPPSGTCERARERRFIDAAGGGVKRAGGHLSLATTSGKMVEFIDWSKPGNRTAEGDSESHWYLGQIDGSGYHRVEVRFGHDAPGSFLINPANGKTTFVHNGGDVVAVSPNGTGIVVFNALNPPLSLRLGALDATGPRLELHCEAQGNELSLQFKGWRDAHAFDLVVNPKGARGDESIPVRVEQNAGAWRMATPDPTRFAGTVGFVCRG